jgi:hypothetical protein
MKLLHHLAILTLPIVVLARPGTRVEPPRVADFAIRDGLFHGHAHMGANLYPRQVNNILEPRGKDRTTNFDPSHWADGSKALKKEADELREYDRVLEEKLRSV